MKEANYYNQLPENYKIVKVIDAKNKKTSIMFILVNLVLTGAALAIGLYLMYREYGRFNYDYLAVLLLLASFIAYIVLHELVHGLFYKIFTHQKLTFGFTLTVAFCGVPKLYVSRKTAIVTTLAPFTVFSIIFLLLVFIVPVESIKLLFVVLFAFHLGGCFGDLFGAIYMIFNHTKEKMLINDTGPTQTFFCKEDK